MNNSRKWKYNNNVIISSYHLNNPSKRKMNKMKKMVKRKKAIWKWRRRKKERKESVSLRQTWPMPYPSLCVVELKSYTIKSLLSQSCAQRTILNAYCEEKMVVMTVVMSDYLQESYYQTLSLLCLPNYLFRQMMAACPPQFYLPNWVDCNGHDHSASPVHVCLCYLPQLDTLPACLMSSSNQWEKWRGSPPLIPMRGNDAVREENNDNILIIIGNSYSYYSLMKKERKKERKNDLGLWSFYNNTIMKILIMSLPK